MILIGQYDSPFVRRVGIALRHYGLAFEHRPWSVFKDAEELARHNPLRRVPVLVLDDGTNLFESSAILDSVDEMVAPSQLLLPRSGPVRRDGLRVCALATGIADKAVSLFYETLLRPSPSTTWLERCRTQVSAALDGLEAERALRPSSYWLGEWLSHADIAVACALRFVREAQPGLWDGERWPGLARDGERCESQAVFREIAQPFTVTLGRQGTERAAGALTEAEANAFANKHVAVWNTHDLDAILQLYADDVELTSPLAAHVVGDGVVRGKARLREYFARALAQYPDLRFELLNTLRCANSVTLYFKSVSDKPVAEVLFLDDEGKIAKVFAHYSC